MPGAASLIAGGVSVAGSLFGGKSGSDNSLKGFNYLGNNAAINGAQNAGANASGAQSRTQGAIADLLGVGGGSGGTAGTPGTPAGGLLYPDQATRGKTPLEDIHAAQAQGRTITPAQWAQAGMNPDGTPMAGTPGTPGTSGGSGNGFSNYLNSTGYKFQLQQGAQAITGNAAARGNLNSGATGKALETFGQNIGAGYFNNYLSQLGSLNTQQGNTAALGVNAAEAVGSAGTTGGGNAGAAQQSAISTAGGTAAGVLSKIDFKNFLGGP